MKVEIYSRKAVKELLQGAFSKNTAVISFYSPAKTSKAEDGKISFAGVCDCVFYVMIPDIDIEVLGECGYTYETYLDEADKVAEFIYDVREKGRDKICQCDYGQSRSAACAAVV